ALHGARVVQRREHREVVDVDLDEVVDERRGEEPSAAVDDAVPDRDGRLLLERGAVLRERVEHGLEAVGVVVDTADRVVLGRRGRLCPVVAVLRHLVHRAPLALADALDEARREAPLGLDVDQLVLERRRTAVADEDHAHERSAPSACAWIAVIATVLTMSSTSAPRDGSLMGLFSPCRTGPIATAPAERCTAL